MTRRSLFGSCLLCAERKAKAAMIPHLRTCVAAQVPPKGARAAKTLLLLRAEQSGAPMYWLDRQRHQGPGFGRSTGSFGTSGWNAAAT